MFPLAHLSIRECAVPETSGLSALPAYININATVYPELGNQGVPCQLNGKKVVKIKLEVNISSQLSGPRWYSGKISLSKLESLSLKPDALEYQTCLRAWCTLNMPWVKRPLAGVVRKFEEGGASSGVVLVISPLFKSTRSVPR
ncbi:hypothetical protein AVEN_145233-1 [Araneus ventricosus]|uniref:Uncharacterized protein n=1 Tax=Araneus ventricosus TaxID=182803 RepID=A0A4Y2WL97_ARAVE|nr:hypothetical protein AVEN_145233-1 [Araneus ventricosus]